MLKYKFWVVCAAVEATVRWLTTDALVQADKAALATIAVPLALGAGNKPAAAVAKLADAFVTITFETEYKPVSRTGRTTSPAWLKFKL